MKKLSLVCVAVVFLVISMVSATADSMSQLNDSLTGIWYPVGWGGTVHLTSPSFWYVYDYSKILVYPNGGTISIDDKQQTYSFELVENEKEDVLLVCSCHNEVSTAYIYLNSRKDFLVIEALTGQQFYYRKMTSTIKTADDPIEAEVTFVYMTIDGTILDQSSRRFSPGTYQITPPQAPGYILVNQGALLLTVDENGTASQNYLIFVYTENN